MTHSLFNVPAGVAQREAAIKRVTEAHQPWVALGIVAVATVIDLGGEFLTTDDVWQELTNRQVPPPPEHRAMAAVIRACRKEGWIEPTEHFIPSQIPWAHRRPMRVWRIVR